MKNRRLKVRIVMVLLLEIMLISFGSLAYMYQKNRMILTDRYLKDDNLYLLFNKEGSCRIDSSSFIVLDSSNACVIPYDADIDEIAVRNKLGLIYTISDLDFSYMDDVNLWIDHYYVAEGGTQKIHYTINGESEETETSFLSFDETIAFVEDNGTIHGISEEETIIEVRIMDRIFAIQITVSDLIDPITEEFNFDKPYLSSGLYTEEENDLLDEILSSRILEAGMQTRAAAVAAARFLALEFPYRIDYFTENGRINSYIDLYCDGEGRYYHKGLYLNESRYKEIDPALIVAGPAVWGDDLYEYSNNRWWVNGLDCSGFISWALLQAGYDPGDLGAGIAEWEDLSDLGEKVWLKDALENDTLRTGDLLSGGEDAVEGGHIAMVAGIRDGYYYIAESQEDNEKYWGLCIRCYSEKELTEYFYWQIDMNAYYMKDGNLTDDWLDD